MKESHEIWAEEAGNVRPYTEEERADIETASHLLGQALDAIEKARWHVWEILARDLDPIADQVAEIQRELEEL